MRATSCRSRYPAKHRLPRPRSPLLGSRFPESPHFHSGLLNLTGIGLRGEKSMSGHSKWHSIKHKKGAIDAKRGRMFTKVIKEITIAARIGGGDVEGNPRLRKAVSDAKELNMPADNIKRAIMKGTGELEGGQLEELTYEGYGPSGVALIVEVVTDNRNRTVSEIRHVFSKNGGNMGESGSVAWMFHKKGYIGIEKSKADEETLMTLAIDAGADDFQSDESSFEIYTSPEAFER